MRRKALSCAPRLLFSPEVGFGDSFDTKAVSHLAEERFKELLDVKLPCPKSASRLLGSVAGRVCSGATNFSGLGTARVLKN